MLVGLSLHTPLPQYQLHVVSGAGKNGERGDARSSWLLHLGSPTLCIRIPANASLQGLASPVAWAKSSKGKKADVFIG